MATSLRIIGFHNCDGCAQKVRVALRRIGVELVEFDRENGIVMITTAEPSEVIRQALKRQLKKPIVVVSGDLVPINQISNHIVSHQVRANRGLDIQELGQTVLRLAQELDGVEITHSNTIKINFIRQTPLVVRSEPHGNIGVRIRDVDAEHASPGSRPPSPQWAAIEPSAPLMSSTREQVAYGYPVPDYYRASTPHNYDHPNGCCGIL